MFIRGKAENCNSVCNWGSHIHVLTWGKGIRFFSFSLLYREKKEVGRVIVNRVHGLSLTKSLSRKKKVLFPVGFSHYQKA